jgi:hypothetical protein
MWVKIIARIKTKNSQAKIPSASRAVLMDKDSVSDDTLAEATPSPDGIAEFLFDLSEASSMDSPMERTPDLFVVLLAASGEEICRTDVVNHVCFTNRDPVSGDFISTLEIDFYVAGEHSS